MCELDALVAEKVMGLVRCAKCDPVEDCWARPESPRQGSPCEPYSTEIHYAWRVVERMRELGWQYELHSFYRGNRHEARFFHPIHVSPGMWVHAPDVPRTICLAALRALGHQPTEQPSGEGE